MGSVRDYALLWLREGGSSSGSHATALGGDAIIKTPRHKLDGPEHLEADDTTDLDASVGAHGLMPKLPGDPELVFDGSGAFRAEMSAGGLVPYYIPVAETFTVPLYRQALFSEAIEVDGGLVVNGLLLGVD